MFKGVKIHLKSASHGLSENDILGLHENLNFDITMKREEIHMFIETHNVNGWASTVRLYVSAKSSASDQCLLARIQSNEFQN
jgi:hypothetical protein